MHEALEKLPEDARNRLKREAMPSHPSPMLATLTHEHFSDPDWIYERKLDGQRCLFIRKNGTARMVSRNGKEQNSFYPEIADALQALPGEFILDGELVTFDGNLSSFSRLQKRMHVQNPDARLLRECPVFAYFFDVLWLDDFDLTELCLRQRKTVLRAAFDLNDPLRHMLHRNENGEALLAEACRAGVEGLIAKHAGSRYVQGRSKKWLKFKCGNGQEFVIAGFTEPKGDRPGFGALLIGFYKGDRLIYAGRVGTGFDNEFRQDFRKRMEKYRRKTCPFTGFDESDSDITWMTPHFVAEVGFTEWTDDGKLRHPRFIGLRRDKDPKDVVREDAPDE